MNKLYTLLDRKFKFSAQDSDMEYLFWRSKNPPIFYDSKLPLDTLNLKYLFLVFIETSSRYIKECKVWSRKLQIPFKY